MKSILTILIVLCGIPVLSSFNINSTVYICGPNGAARYHFTKGCRGLSNCKQGIYSAPLSKAQEMGLTLCGWED